MYLAVNQIQRRGEIVGWFTSGSNLTPKQKKERQKRLNKEAIARNKSDREMAKVFSRRPPKPTKPKGM